MSKVKKLNLEEIMYQVELKFKEPDVNKFCKDKEVAQLMKEAKESELDKIIIQNEDKIDVEKLLFFSWIRGKEIVDELEVKLSNKKESKLDRERMKIDLQKNKNELAIIKQLTKGLDIYIVTAIAMNGIIENIEVISSKETMHKANLKDKEKVNRILFDKIDKKNSEQDNTNMGINYIIQCLDLKDLFLVMPEDIASAVSYKIEHNTCILCREKVERLNQKQREHQDDDEEAINLTKQIRENGIIPETKKCIEELLKYIDLEKLLLLSIYGFESVLEGEIKKGYQLPKKDVVFIKEMAEDVLTNISKSTKVSKEDFEYGHEDIKNLISRIDEKTGEYVSKQTVKELKEKLLSGANIDEMDSTNVPYLYMIPLSKEELKEIMKISKENFAFGLLRLRPSEEQILEMAKKAKDKWSEQLTKHLIETGSLSTRSALKLFYDGLISAEFFKEFSEETDISSEINLQKIHEDYQYLKQQREIKSEDEILLDKKIELYKELNLKGKEETQEETNDFMYQIAEDFEDDADILFCYKKGLITLETVAQWGGNSLILKLYNQAEINLENVGALYSKGEISQDFIQNIVLRTKPDYNKLIEYINLGYISEDKIIDFYMRGKIFDKDFENIAKQGRISPYRYYEASTKRTMETLEETAQIKFEPELVNIPDKKIHLNIVEEPEEHSAYASSNGAKTLIDPGARYELLELLGAKKAKAIIPEEDNAFYNYEFFVIPDSTGKLQANSVVIAERFYKDKEYQDEFSVDNATYFFQYKDLMVNSNLTKKEMTEGRENIVFTANHRAGSWAVSMLYRVAQTMASTDFKEYKKGDERAGRVIDELLKIYSQEDLKKILDMTGRIDDTNEFIYEEVNSSFSQKGNKSMEDQSSEGR